MDPLEAYLWECKDYADGWIKFDRERDARDYQHETGCVMRVYYRSVQAAKPVEPA